MGEVVELEPRRARKVPAWNADTQRHAWEDVSGEPCPACDSTPETEHRCGHCEIVVRSAQAGGVWIQHFAAPQPDGSVKRGRMESRGKCRGPRRHLELVAPPAPLEQSTRPCCRCVPPLPACGSPTRLYLGGWLCDMQARAQAAAGRGGAA